MNFDKLSRRWSAILAGLVTLFLASSAQAAYALNMTESVTPLGRELYSLHMLVFWICVVIGLAVFGVMAYSIIYHRKSRGAVAANFHESTTV